MLTHLSLFSGIGGLDLAAELAGFQSVGQCEWADYPTKVLEQHWPDVPRWRDIRTLTGEDFYARTGLRTVDLISGGFPCQPFSSSGKRRGREDDRFLWPEMLRVVQEIRPTWVIGENVAGIINMALDTVLSDLEGIGYACQAFIIPACAVDAPHRRDRCAIIGYRCGEMESEYRGHRWPSGSLENPDSVRRGEQEILPKQQRRAELERNGEDVAHANGADGERPIILKDQAGRPKPPDIRLDVSDAYDRSRPLRRDAHLSAPKGHGGHRRDHDRGAPEHGSWERRTAEPGMGGGPYGLSCWLDGVRAGWADGTWEAGIPRIATGVSNRVSKLQCLGNAVVPQQFYPFFKAIHDIEDAI